MRLRNLLIHGAAPVQPATMDCPPALIEILALRSSWRLDVLGNVPPLEENAAGDLVDMASLTTTSCPVAAGRLDDEWNAVLKWRAGTATVGNDVRPPRWRFDVGADGIATSRLRDFVNLVRKRTLDRLHASGPMFTEHVADGSKREMAPGQTVDILPFSAAFEVSLADSYRLTDLARWTPVS